MAMCHTPGRCLMRGSCVPGVPSEVTPCHADFMPFAAIASLGVVLPRLTRRRA